MHMRKVTLGKRLVVCVAALLICANTALAAEWVYTVRPGDHLWNITERYTKSLDYWKPLLRLNQLERPREMPPGTRIRIPVRWLKLQPVPAHVVTVAGEARRIRDPGGSAVPIEVGMELELGDIVETAVNGSLTMEFADGSQLLVRPDTRLSLDTIRAYEGTGMVDTRMGLERGRVESDVEPSVGPGTRFEIHTPVAVTSVRGTRLRVGTSDAGQATQVEVVEGRVGVSGGGGSRSVNEGFGTVIRADEPPLRPRPLLPAADLGTAPLLLDRLPLRLSWSEVEGASTYRVLVARDADFQTLLVDVETARGDLPGVELPDGEYVVRVRAVDELGLEGLSAEAEMVIDARPEPPFPTNPTPEEVVRSNNPVFLWSVPQGADAYLFQLARSPDFATPLLREDDLRSPTFNVAAELPPGDYLWRVATRQGDETGPFSDPQPFTIRPAPASPELEPPEVSDSKIVLRWRAANPGQRYEYQLAWDSTFRDLVTSEVVAEPEAILEDPVTGYYYLRVRVIDLDGYVGSFGTAQQIYVPPESYWPAVAPLGLLLLLLIL